MTTNSPETLTELATVLEAAQKAERFAPRRVRRIREEQARRHAEIVERNQARIRIEHPEFVNADGEIDYFLGFGE